jgi:hypothetical protein
VYVSKDEREFELQVFDGKEYRAISVGRRDDLEQSLYAMVGKVRRLVVPGKHPARPKYRRPARYTGPGASKDAAILGYLQWAKAAGLTQVHAYEGQQLPDFGIQYRRVQVGDFLGPVTEDAPEVAEA